MPALRVAASLLPAWHPVPGGTWVALRSTLAAIERLGTVDLVGVTASGPPVAPLDLDIATVPLGRSRRAAYLSWAAGFGPSPADVAEADVSYLGAPAMPPGRTKPIVITLHDVLPLEHPEMFTRVGAWQMRRALAAARDDATEVIVSSEATRHAALRLGFVDERLTVVPLGVARRESGPEVDADRRARRLRLGVDRPYVLWVGTAEPRKGLDVLVDAWREAARSSTMSDVELVLVGPDGWGEAASTDEVPRVRHLGQVSDDDLDAVLAGAGLFVFPSRAEGFGLPPLEAMARGVPVMVRGGTACAEVVGDGGVVVDAAEPSGWADQIVATWADTSLRANTSTAAVRRSESFTWERTAMAVVQVLERAAT